MIISIVITIIIMLNAIIVTIINIIIMTYQVVEEAQAGCV